MTTTNKSKNTPSEPKPSIRQYVVIDGVTYPIDTDEQHAAAKAALQASSEDQAEVWFGDPEDPSSYPSTVHRLVR